MKLRLDDSSMASAARLGGRQLRRRFNRPASGQPEADLFLTRDLWWVATNRSHVERDEIVYGPLPHDERLPADAPTWPVFLAATEPPTMVVVQYPIDIHDELTPLRALRLFVVVFLVIQGIVQVAQTLFPELMAW